MIKAIATLGVLAFLLILAAYLLGWNTPIRDVKIHAVLGSAALVVQITQVITSWAVLVTSRDRQTTARQLLPLRRLAVVGSLMTLSSVALGFVLHGWSPYPHLAFATASLSFNAGLAAVGLFAARTERRASAAASPTPASKSA